MSANADESALQIHQLLFLFEPGGPVRLLRVLLPEVRHHLVLPRELLLARGALGHEVGHGVLRHEVRGEQLALHEALLTDVAAEVMQALVLLHVPLEGEIIAVGLATLGAVELDLSDLQ